MYIEIVGYFQDPKTNRTTLDIKFHEGPFHNKVFKVVDGLLVLRMLQGIKIPFSELDFEWLKVREVYISKNDLSTVKFIDEVRKILPK